MTNGRNTIEALDAMVDAAVIAYGEANRAAFQTFRGTEYGPTADEVELMHFDIALVNLVEVSDERAKASPEPATHPSDPHAWVEFAKAGIRRVKHRDPAVWADERTRLFNTTVVYSRAEQERLYIEARILHASRSAH